MKLEAGVTYKCRDGSTTTLVDAGTHLLCPLSKYYYGKLDDDLSPLVYPYSTETSPRDIIGTVSEVSADSNTV